MNDFFRYPASSKPVPHDGKTEFVEVPNRQEIAKLPSVEIGIFDKLLLHFLSSHGGVYAFQKPKQKIHHIFHKSPLAAVVLASYNSINSHLAYFDWSYFWRKIFALTQTASSGKTDFP